MQSQFKQGRRTAFGPSQTGKGSVGAFLAFSPPNPHTRRFFPTFQKKEFQTAQADTLNYTKIKVKTNTRQFNRRSQLLVQLEVFFHGGGQRAELDGDEQRRSGPRPQEAAPAELSVLPVRTAEEARGDAERLRAGQAAQPGLTVRGDQSTGIAAACYDLKRKASINFS